MKLDDIGFYTLSDRRAKQCSAMSPLWRCELIITGRCDLKCMYCRGLKEEISSTISLSKAKKIIDMWAADGLKNIRLSGGEPTVHPELIQIVQYCKDSGIDRIAISTNGNAKMRLYQKLIKAGVNDFSISLDSCCAAISDKICGKTGTWGRVIENIKYIARQVYTTVGVVINEENVKECIETITFASSLGVHDIRVIPSAQHNEFLSIIKEIPESIMRKHPILRYRVKNAISGRHVRGIRESDTTACWLVLDDMAIAGDYHFPCIIYMREGGEPIGKVSKGMRWDRLLWSREHDASKDSICRDNCLDVCIDYNNRCSYLKGGKQWTLK